MTARPGIFLILGAVVLAGCDGSPPPPKPLSPRETADKLYWRQLKAGNELYACNGAVRAKLVDASSCEGIEAAAKRYKAEWFEHLGQHPDAYFDR